MSKVHLAVLLVLLSSLSLTVNAQWYGNGKQNCYGACTKDSDCGSLRGPGCTYCIHGACTCGTGLAPCNTDSYAGGDTPYACMNTSTEYCSSNAGPQPLSNACEQNPSVCGTGYTCTNTPDSYKCDVVDPDPCKHKCASVGASCSNSSGSYSCRCLTGFKGDGYTCADVDECANTSTCAAGIKCTNSAGSFMCNGTKMYFLQNPSSNLVLTGGMQGTTVYMADKKAQNFMDQLWSYVPGEGGFIVNVQTGLALDITNGNAYAGAEVILWEKKVTISSWSNNQMWTYNPTSLSFTSKAGSYNLDIKSASTTPNTPVILWTRKTSQNSNQQFKLMENV